MIAGVSAEQLGGKNGHRDTNMRKHMERVHFLSLNTKCSSHNLYTKHRHASSYSCIPGAIKA